MTVELGFGKTTCGTDSARVWLLRTTALSGLIGCGGFVSFCARSCGAVVDGAGAIVELISGLGFIQRDTARRAQAVAVAAAPQRQTRILGALLSLASSPRALASHSSGAGSSHS